VSFRTRGYSQSTVGSLTKRCSGSFSSRAWHEGGEDFRRQLVDVYGVGRNGFNATVRAAGGDLFDITVDWSDAAVGLVYASCTCDQFSESSLCKHIAASLMQVEKQRPRLELVGPWRLEVVPDEVFFDYVDDDDDGGFGGTGASTPPMRPAKDPDWRAQLAALAPVAKQSTFSAAKQSPAAVKPDRLVWYRLNLQTNTESDKLVIEFCRRRQTRSGELGPPTEWRISLEDLPSLAEPLDRELVSLMLAATPRRNEFDVDYGAAARYRSCALATQAIEWVLPKLCRTGRFGWISGHDLKNEPLHPLSWDEGPPLETKFRMERGGKSFWRLQMVLCRADEVVAADQILAIFSGYVVFADRIARLASSVSAETLLAARRGLVIQIPVGDQDKFVETLAESPRLPPIDLPEELRWPEQTVEPVPRLTISAPPHGDPRAALTAELTFDYDGVIAPARDTRRLLADGPRKRLLVRDPQAELAAHAKLFEAGAKPPSYYDVGRIDAQVPRQKFPRVVAAVTEAGWHVEAEGKLLRRAISFNISVSSAVDWFELDARADYDGATVGLPELLAAAKRGDRFVTLGDGSQGMLPDEWLARYAPLAKMGEAEGDKLRFKPSQALLLDAWLSAQPEVDVDRAFDEVRRRLHSFQGIRPCEEPRGFTGTLRPYQREGLGWLMFLAEFGFGGCLADDMGLGKTIQVLAMFAERRARLSAGDRVPDAERPARPSLVVVPRSLVQNWLEEARRFTPELRVLDYTGLARDLLRQRFEETDLVVTTYGTLRRDAGQLKDVAFDYAVLDEAQAIKNAASQAAKACRLLTARHRLAMTGTPVENHLGELWSIIEFLNPGMLGRSNSLKALSGKAGSAGESVDLLGKALRPFILRRTKQQVLTDLPDKTEQTLYCELEGRQRKLYDQLRDHYRQSLKERIERVGIEKAKIHVLEALLRLRQAACHPGLIDSSYRKQTSAKLETLLEQLNEVLGEGHKALVFSQFTSLLAIVRDQLDRRGLVYEYLDGKTRDRQARVDRFQQDASCPLFLISLKAGGLGLNLTAADYVFILDPWWNPAVEAQAVDRAHRIGQARRVFAYRLIARDTVEEKILQLQGEKRKLADAIVSADNSLIGQLTADDLRRLLS
jgi:superfamily II DNA or RNA helicase